MADKQFQLKAQAKPVSAVRWLKDGDSEEVLPFKKNKNALKFECPHGCKKSEKEHGSVVAVEGSRMVCPGDWIVTLADGNVSHMKHDLFVKTYEEVKA